MNKNAILKNIEDLSSNAMFAMSQTSKELFHSNFWAWMLRKYPQIFTKVFYPKYDGKSKVEVFREKHHFDLMLKIDDEIHIDCGRDLKVYSDILFYFPGAWDKNETKRQDLCYLGISLWGNDYRYYAGLHKAQCGITKPKNGRYDKENKILGFKYLTDNYGWLFNQENTGQWNGYSNDSEMYLYKKIDVSNLTIEQLTQKVQLALEMIHTYIEDFCNKKEIMICHD